MRLDTPCYRLPWRFDAARLAGEHAALAEPSGSVALVAPSAGGRGPSHPTSALAQCPCALRVLAALDTVIGAARFAHTGPEPRPEHDSPYSRFHRARVLIPVALDAEAKFVAEGGAVPVRPGECWLIDTERVRLDAPASGLVLEIDTVGSEAFWDAVEGAERPFAPHPRPAPEVFVPDAPGGAGAELRLEAVGAPVLMSPWEQECLVAETLAEVPAAAGTQLAELRPLLVRFARGWRAAWAVHGDAPAGWPDAVAALRRFERDLRPWLGRVALADGGDLAQTLLDLIVRPAHNPDLRNAPMPPPVEPVVRAKSAAPVAVPQNPPAAPESSAEQLRAVNTSTLGPLLRSLGASLAVSTYQAGKLVLVRADGDDVNTHFRTFPMPMGIAVQGHTLALGAGNEVWHFQNRLEVARKLHPEGRHDACFLPRRRHYTGDIRVHEIAFAGDELWIVNTRFSCLCTLDAEHSFVPRWRPSFVSRLAPEDRCHLNGLAVRDGRPRYVTCLGATDTPGGWRADKRSGGLLLDLAPERVLLEGLSMPHSPRWHRGALWFLESGDGGLNVVHEGTGKPRTVARLPGFTRGLDFCGDYAFVGLSQVRETATFAGLPLTDRPGERMCGVWAVDTRDGRVVAFLRFESGVHEVFAVHVLAGAAYPELLNEAEPEIASSFVLPPA